MAAVTPLEDALRHTRKRILINDYCGHPFQVELSRELARRGHEVLHVYSADDQTPKGDLTPRPGDPRTFEVEGVSIGAPLQKYGNLARRRRQERAYGRLMCRRIESFKPDIVVGSNNPLEAQNQIGGYCRTRSIPFVYWLQDVHSDAIRGFLNSKSAAAGMLLGSWYERMEKRLLRNASHVIAIADNFMPRLTSWQVPKSRISIVENWAPKNQIRVGTRDNSWRRAQGFSSQRIVLYTGTIGLKHNPDLLLAAAQSLTDMADVRLVVVSGGKYADYLGIEGQRRGLSNLKVLPFQPFETYGDVLASADVLVAMIEPDAAEFSVPSKVLSYLCSGRPIVLSASKHNLAARTIERAGAGAVVDPRDPDAFVEAVRSFLSHDEVREQAGARGREYADTTFDVARIADRFEPVLLRACESAIAAEA
jgi:glycosyltransferase involved in cell wall biosynthesis